MIVNVVCVALFALDGVSEELILFDGQKVYTECI